MKKRLGLFSVLILMSSMTISLMGYARGGDGDDVEKKKNISKTYAVSPNDKLSITNSFGEVNVNLWDKQEVKVEVEITVSASTDQKAQALLNNIEIKEQQYSGNISFHTNVKGSNNGSNWSKSKKEGNTRKLEINYSIYMPASNPLDIENSFGKTNIPDFKGPISLTSKFGSLTAGHLANVTLVDVEFGTADIGSIHNGEVTFKFNNRSTVNQVSGNIKLKTEFSGNVRFGIGDDIQELGIFGSYSSLTMVVSKALSANFDIRTSFGSFQNNSGFPISANKEETDDFGPNFDKTYSGATGGGKAKIKIKSSFGNIRITDSWDKSKDKSDDEGDDDEKGQKAGSKKGKVSA